MDRDILIVGEFQFNYYEKDFSSTLVKLGVKTYEFRIWNEMRFFNFFLKIEYHFSFPFIFTELLYYFVIKRIAKSRSKKPMIIFLWRPTLLNTRLIKKIKATLKKDDLLVAYNNDNPFSERYLESNNLHQKYLWRNFKKVVPLFDVSIVYRPENIRDYADHGAKKVIMFPPGYPNYLENRYQHTPTKYFDVVFIGHYEKKRLDYINALLEAGIDVKIYGPGWKITEFTKGKYRYDSIAPIYGYDYYDILSKSKVSLCFLSELNKDVYTRRTFEIPICNTVMVSERTKAISQLFEEGREVLLFNTKKELIDKVSTLLKNPQLEQSIRTSGRKAAIKKGYSLQSRVFHLLKELNNL